MSMERPRSSAVATIGTPVRRREDYRFLTGGGTYTDDINRPGQLHAFILRSPYAHAQINGIDTTAAQHAPGVVAVYSGKDMATDGIGEPSFEWICQPQGRPPTPSAAMSLPL